MTEATPPEPAEPSMEEILASIRQIISDDLASAAAPERGADDGEDDDVLILKERAPPEPSPFAPPSEDPPRSQTPESPAPGPDPQEAKVEHEPENPGAGTLEARPEAGRSLTVAPSFEPAVVAPETAAVVAASFERLSFVVENTPPPPPFAISGGGATLEDITRDILTPVIKAWLDENLPAIVRARVDEEVERITRSRVR